MRRRDLLTGTLGIACAMALHPGRAQTSKRARLAYLSGGSKGFGETSIVDILKAALHELGWRQGETLDLEERFAEGDFASLPRLARELVALGPDILVATGSTETMSLHAVTQNIPIVFMLIQDPVSLGIVESIPRPGGNITGFTQGPQVLWGKRLELLAELLGRQPRRLAYLGNPGNVGSVSNWTDAKDAAATVGAEIVRTEVGQASELRDAFDALKSPDALLVPYDFLYFVLRGRIAELAAEKRIPAVYENRGHVLAGGLMSYGGDVRENYRLGAGYVDRILKGARPADLPVVAPSRFELVLNIGAAKALGLTVPPFLLARADEVIE
jgi:putative tryptophan/tyrosine transport system substrate-binding protein